MLPWNRKCNLLAKAITAADIKSKKCATVCQFVSIRESWKSQSEILSCSSMNEWMDEWMDEKWMNELENEWTPLSLSNSADLRSTSHLDTERSQSGVADSEPRQSQLAIGTATAAAAAAGGIVRITAPIVQLPFLSLSPLNLNCSPITGKSPSFLGWDLLGFLVPAVANVSTVMAKLLLLLLLLPAKWCEAGKLSANYR